MTTELLPCPICGSRAKAVTGPVKDLWGVSCTWCDLWSDSRKVSEEEAVAAWNRRAETRCNNCDQKLACPECGDLGGSE